MAEEKNKLQPYSQSSDLEFFSRTLSIPEIFTRIQNFLDSYFLIQLCLVNKSWYAMTIPIVFDHFQKELPHPVTHGYLLKAIAQDFQSVPGSFSEDRVEPYQKSLFQRYMHDHFNEDVDGSETFLDYINRVSQLFLQDDPSEFPFEIPVGHSYIEMQMANLIQEMNFLFNHAAIKLFTDQYDLEKNLIKKPKETDYLFIIQYLSIIKKVESFLTTLILFNKVDNQSIHGLQIDPVLKNQQWILYLSGSGLVALFTRQKTHSIRCSILASSLSRDNFKTFTIQESRYLLSKIKPSDLLTILPLHLGKTINQTIQARQPEILGILCSETRASDHIILFLIEYNCNSFLNVLDAIPELAIRLRHPIFLKRFFESSLSEVKKYTVAQAILNRPAWVADLHHIDINIVFELAKIALPTCYNLLAAFVREDDCFLSSIENDRSLLSKFTLEQITHLWEISKAPNKAYLQDAKLKTSWKRHALTLKDPPIFPAIEIDSDEKQHVDLTLQPLKSNQPQQPKNEKPLQNSILDPVQPKNLAFTNPPSPSRLPQPPITNPQKKSFDWLFWILLGLLILAGSGLILNLSSIFEVPSALSIIQALSEFFGNCSVTNMNMGLLIGSILVGIVSGVSLLIKTCCRGSGESTTNNCNPEAKNPWEHTANAESSKQLYPTTHPLQTKPEKPNSSPYTPANSSQTTNNLNPQHTFN